MTLGQRIQYYRNQKGMSQESLGEALGVSRQAVSKWEADNGIPEISTLISLSRLFSVTVGQLLGIEDTKDEICEPDVKSVTPDEDLVIAVLHRYADEQIVDRRRQNRIILQWALLAAAFMIGVIIVLFAQMESLRNTVNWLQSDIASLQMNVSNQQNNLSGQIRNTIYDVLAEEAKLLNTFEWELAELHLEEQTAIIRLRATMKTYEAGSDLQFYGNWTMTDETKGQSVGTWVQGPDFSAELTLPLNYITDIGIRVRNENGDIQEQLVDQIHDLHPEHFRLTAYNLTAPFAVSSKFMGGAVSTTRAEEVYVSISSPHSEFIWPEKAVLTASLNGEEIFREELKLQESERERNIFLGSIQDTYFAVSMKNGDVLEVAVTMTDNFGRTEQFQDNIAIRDGRIEHAPIAAPVVPVGN